MARRILPADNALTPNAQNTLSNISVRTEPRRGTLSWLDGKWAAVLELPGNDILFDWDAQAELMKEIAFVNETRERIDEAALKVAPSMLRIVLTVKQNITDIPGQRAWLAEHVDWDFRRISELCIVADSYGLLDTSRRQGGEAELKRYGWSNALKLAYVREREEREGIWERARGDKEQASYRAVLEEIKRYRERKQIAPPTRQEELHTRMAAAREAISLLGNGNAWADNSEACRDMLQAAEEAHRELGRLKRALKERLQTLDTEELAQSA